VRPGIWVLVALLGGATTAHADPHLELRAAQQELKLARKALKGAGRSYDGHRLQAIAQVEAALREVRDALTSARAGHDREDE
jgi:hypothetical protein